MFDSLKIGFAGNTNNYPLTLALAFARMGHDVKFLVDSSDRLYRPENRYDKGMLSGIKILDISPFGLDYSGGLDANKIKQLVDFFADRQLMILNSHFISLYNKIKVPHLPLLTGSDLDYLASDRYVNQFKYNYLASTLSIKQSTLSDHLLTVLSRFLPSTYPPKKFLYSKLKVVRFVASAQLLNYVKQKRKNQVSGISTPPLIIYFPKGLIESGDKVLRTIRPTKDTRVFNLMTDTFDIPFSPANKHNGPVRIFNVARFNWNSKNAPSFFTELDFKGNDIMIKGLHLFRIKYPEVSLKVILVKKGVNLEETYELIDKLELNTIVSWVCEMSQTEVLEEFKAADIVFDQLGTSLVAMGGLDALAVGRPLIANWRPEFFEQYAGKWPVCQATNETEVLNWLEILILNPDKRLEIGLESRKFVEEKLSSEAFAKRILQTLEKENYIKCAE